RGDRRSQRRRRHQAGHGVLLRHAAVFHGGRAAARRLLRQILRVPRGHQGGALHARRHRRARQRRGLLLLSDDRQGDVFRRAGRRIRGGAARTQSGAGRHRRVRVAVLRLSFAAGRRGRDGRQVAVLMNAPSSAAQGARLVSLDAVGSTNAEAFARARGGERGPLWVAARRQTAGRGRRGRAWVAEPGNLYASRLLTDPAPPQRAAELSLVAALALHDALAERASVLGPRLALKWPNDVLCDGAKLAGILVEGETLAGGPLAVVIG